MQTAHGARKTFSNTTAKHSLQQSSGFTEEVDEFSLLLVTRFHPWVQHVSYGKTLQCLICSLSPCYALVTHTFSSYKTTAGDQYLSNLKPFFNKVNTLSAGNLVN